MCFFALGSWKTTTQRKLTDPGDAGEMESIQEIYLQSCTSSCQMLLLRWNNPGGITLHLLITSHYIPRELMTSLITKPLKKCKSKKKILSFESLEFLGLCLACGSQPEGAEEALPGLLLATARVAGRQHCLNGEKLHPTGSLLHANEAWWRLLVLMP